MIPRIVGVGLITGLGEVGIGLYMDVPLGALGLLVGITLMALIFSAALAPHEPDHLHDVANRTMRARLEDVSLLKELVRDGMSADTLVELFTDVMARISQGLITAADTQAYVEFLLRHEAGEPIPLSAAGIRVVDPPALTNANFRFFAAGISQVTRLIQRLVAEHDVTPEELTTILFRYMQVRTNEFDHGPLGVHLAINPEAEFRWAERQLSKLRESYLVIA